MLIARRNAAKAVVETVQEEQPVAKPEKAVVPAADEAVEKRQSIKKAPKVKKAFKPKKK